MNSGICSLLALIEALIDSWISSMISLFLCFPFDEFPKSSLIDYLIAEPDEAANYSRIDSLIPLYPE